MQGLSNNIIELQLYSNQHLTTCILTFEEYASFHRHVRDVEDVCPSLTAHSILKSTAATCEHPSPSLHLIKDGKNILHVHPLHYTLLVLSSYYNYYLPCLASTMCRHNFSIHFNHYPSVMGFVRTTLAWINESLH